jgi:heme A synthase
MKATYRVVASLIALGVVFQAAVIAFGVFESIDTGIAISGGPDQPIVGASLHSLVGMGVIPILALLLLIFSFFARVRNGRKWALLLLLAVVVQILLGAFAFELPALGLLHGANAFGILALALVAARAARTTEATLPPAAAEQEAPARAGVD